MIGLDTNVLVRYLTQDDARQAAQAKACIDQGSARGETFFISDVVLCELVWVLDSAYGLSRVDIARALESILRTAQFTFADKDVLWQALGDYISGKGDFSDHVIGRLGCKAGCPRTITFDRGLKNSSCFQVITA